MLCAPLKSRAAEHQCQHTLRVAPHNGSWRVGGEGSEALVLRQWSAVDEACGPASDRPRHVASDVLHKFKRVSAIICASWKRCCFLDTGRETARLPSVPRSPKATNRQKHCPSNIPTLSISCPSLRTSTLKEESRANVVINQKMMKVIVSGIPQSVRVGVAMIEDVITFGRSAEHPGSHHPSALDYAGAVAFGGTYCGRGAPEGVALS